MSAVGLISIVGCQVANRRRFFQYQNPIRVPFPKLISVAKCSALIERPKFGQPEKEGILRRILNFVSASIRALRLLIYFAPVIISRPCCWIGLLSHERWLRLLRWTLIQNGPVFTKFGQWASTRRDLFSPLFCDTLSALHSMAIFHPWSKTEKALRQTLGDAWRDLFVEFHPEPLGSGCVAQVYKAELNLESVADWLGAKASELKNLTTTVAVKVLHPNIQTEVQSDLRILKGLASVVETLLPSSRYCQPSKCVCEFEGMLRAQLDLRNEAQSLENFATNFELQKHVRFPRVIKAEESLLIESFEQGAPITKMLGSENEEEKHKLAIAGARALLKMVFVDNLVHGDLHPGNILVNLHSKGEEVQKNDGTGFFNRIKLWLTTYKGSIVAHQKIETTVDSGEPNLVFLDTGITVALKKNDLANLRSLCKAIIQRKGDIVADLLLEHAPSHDCTNPAAFRKDIQALVSKSVQSGLQLGKVEVSSIILQLFDTVRVHRVCLEPRYTGTFLAMLVLEGLARTLDPSMDLLSQAAPYLFVMA